MLSQLQVIIHHPFPFFLKIAEYYRTLSHMGKKEKKKGFYDLVAIMARLRGEGGCPWDRRQTKKDLRSFLIEEVYEIVESLDRGDEDGLCEELGDLLFHIVFLARIAEEEGAFDISDVIDRVAQKMIRRHPHVFGGQRVSSPTEVEQNWAIIKAEEKPKQSLTDGIPRQLPALMKAYRLTQRAAKVGFDWKDKMEVWDKLQEELEELSGAIKNGGLEEMREELGDVLFTLVNLARFIGVDPEEALRRVTDKFAERFRYIERRLHEEGKTPAEATLAEMDTLWEEYKKGKRKSNG